MFWLIVLIILILVIHSILKTTKNVAKAVGKGMAHDLNQIDAEIKNKTTLTQYLDYLVRCKGWEKSGTLLVIYTAPCGKTGSYIQWENRAMASHKATDILTSVELEAFFKQFDGPAPEKKARKAQPAKTNAVPEKKGYQPGDTSWVYQHTEDDDPDPFGDDIDEHMM